MKLDKNTPAHEWWTDSGALQTRKIIYSWTLRHRLWLARAGIESREDREDLTGELLWRLLRRQSMPSRWDSTRGSWAHYVWVFCKSQTINILKKHMQLDPLTSDWVPVYDESGMFDLALDLHSIDPTAKALRESAPRSRDREVRKKLKEFY